MSWPQLQNKICHELTLSTYKIHINFSLVCTKYFYSSNWSAAACKKHQNSFKISKHALKKHRDKGYFTNFIQFFSQKKNKKFIRFLPHPSWSSEYVMVCQNFWYPQCWDALTTKELLELGITYYSHLVQRILWKVFIQENEEDDHTDLDFNHHYSVYLNVTTECWKL